MSVELDNSSQAGASLDKELQAMRTIGAELGALEPRARERVLEWVIAHLGISTSVNARDAKPSMGPLSNANSADREVELPGIAQINADGAVELTVRDLKARSANDAAIRLALILIAIKEKLTGSKTVSSRKELVPLLKEWRAYDGNTRGTIVAHKGIHRRGDELSLDAISRKEAEDYISQVLDDSVHGTWNPTGRPVKKATKKNTPSAGAES